MLTSRRNFLKGIGATGAAGALGSAIGMAEVNAFAAGGDVPVKKEYKGFCMMCKQTGCANIVTTENGVVTDVRGNPAHKGNLGSLCGRGKNAVMHLYNPYRVKVPMKRTNPKKGLDVDPGWMEITWEEALSTVSTKFAAIRADDPRKLLFIYGFAMSEVTMNGMGKSYFFPGVFGTPNYPSSKGQFCAIHYGVGLVQNNMPTSNTDNAYGKYYVFVGRGGGINPCYSSGDARGLADSIEKGLKLVCVDPACTTEGSLGEWVPILPGSDLPFILALTRAILDLGSYDKDFVRDRTNAPYLIKSDGNYLLGAGGKPMIWDTSDSTAKEWDNPALNKANAALSGTYTVGLETVRPSFVLFRDNYATYTPEWAESLCTVPASKIRELAANLVENACIGQTIEVDGHTFPYRPAGIMVGRGTTNHEDGAAADLASKLINLLLGSYYVPGGVQGTGIGPNRLAADPLTGTLTPGYESVPCTSFTYPPNNLDLFEIMPHRHSTCTVALQVINEGPAKWDINYTPEALMVVGGNPVLVNGSIDMCADAICKIPFVVNFAYHFDEITQLSDLIFASPSVLESPGFVDYFGSETSMSTSIDEPDYVSEQTVRFYRNPVPMIYDTRDPNDVLIELLYRMGLGPQLNGTVNAVSLLGERPVWRPMPLSSENQLSYTERYTYQDLIDRSFKTVYAAQGRPEVDLAYLKEHSFVTTYNLSHKEAYPTYHNNTVRFQLYVYTQKQSGDFLLGQMKLNIPEAKLQDYCGLPSYAHLQKHYNATVSYIDQIKIHNAPAEYNLYATTYRLPMSIFRLGGLDHNPWSLDWNNKYNPYYNSVLIHPTEAVRLGLETGDMVTVESEHGSTRGKLLVTKTVHPRACVFPGITGRADKSLGAATANQVCFNKLLCGKLGHISPIHGGIDTTARVKVYKAL